MLEWLQIILPIVQALIADAHAAGAAGQPVPSSTDIAMALTAQVANNKAANEAWVKSKQS